MLKEKVQNGAKRYFEALKEIDDRKSFDDMSPWIFNFYKGDMIGANIMASPPDIDKKQTAFFHIMNLTTFDKFDYVTVSLDTWFTKIQKEDFKGFESEDTPVRDRLDKEEAIMTLGADRFGNIEQSMIIYGRKDNGEIYIKEEVPMNDADPFDGWMKNIMTNLMSTDLPLSTVINIARKETEIFDGAEDKSMYELIKQVKEEWIDLLTSNNCQVAFGPSCSVFNDLDGYEEVHLDREEE